METFSEDQKRRQADMAEAAVRGAVTFRFDDRDLEQIDRLRAEGFKFVTVTMRDNRGFQRDFALWVPPQDREGEPT